MTFKCKKLTFYFLYSTLIYFFVVESLFGRTNALPIPLKFQRILSQNPELLNGGAFIFKEKKDFLALGIGIKNSFHKEQVNPVELKLAIIDARKRLTQTIFGITSKNQTISQDRIFEKNEKAIQVIEEKIRNQEISTGIIKSSECLGAWIDKKSASLKALVIIYGPNVFSLKLKNLKNNPTRNSYENLLLNYPIIKLGGTLLYFENGQIKILSVGFCKLKNDPIKDSIHSPLIAKTKTQVQMVNFILGLKNFNFTEDSTELLERNGEIINFLEKTRSLSKENTFGATRMLKKMDEWRSKDNKFLFGAYSISIKDIFEVD
ncbi:hypothetical protein ACFL35_10575 [Candidatus Riflebacteria bacterium]